MANWVDARELGIPVEEWYSDTSLSRLMEELLIDISATNNASEPSLPIIHGAKVLIKPNWVNHTDQASIGCNCLYTSHEFILAVLKLVLKCKPSSIVLGDAPIQGCDWNRIVTQSFIDRVSEIDEEGIVKIVDFRQTIMKGVDLKEGQNVECRSQDSYTLFDLGQDSLLEPVSFPEGRFRVTMYDPALMRKRHFAGRHQYLVAREVFESDVILNLPKLKTHRKAGITGALKNLVGLIGNKEFIPHHRKGGSKSGGDCYLGNSFLKAIAESLIDQANARIGKKSYSFWKFGIGLILKAHRLFRGDCEIDGGWYGNDTVWRTVLDINRIALYGKINGEMDSQPQRHILTLTDALICGQGNGPLSAKAYPLGCVTFSSNSYDADRLHCALLGFNFNHIPLLREARGDFPWPIVFDRCDEDYYNDSRVKNAISLIGLPEPPPGWNCLEN